MASDPATMSSLPNEILLSILSRLPTALLGPLAPTSHRFHALISRVLHTRLARAAALPHHRLVLECYSPAEQHTAAVLDLERVPRPHPHPHDHNSSPEPGGDGYTRFRPLGGVADPLAIELEADEHFAQLCTAAHLLRHGVVPGQVLGAVTLLEGVMRVWRGWLAEHDGARARGVAADGQGEGERGGAVLWADSAENVGVRFRVRKVEVPFAPVLVGPEELPVRYELRYEEILIRTSRLLLMLEKSEAQEAPIQVFGIRGQYAQYVCFNTTRPPRFFRP